jgi:hypothetical protein
MTGEWQNDMRHGWGRLGKQKRNRDGCAHTHTHQQTRSRNVIASFGELAVLMLITRAKRMWHARLFERERERERRREIAKSPAHVFLPGDSSFRDYREVDCSLSGYATI